MLVSGTAIPLYIYMCMYIYIYVHVCIYLYMCMCLVAQSCLTLCDPLDSSLSGSSVHGIFQTRILEWVAISSSRGSSRPKDRTLVSSVSCIGRQVLNQLHHLGNPWYKCILAYQEPNRIRGWSAGGCGWSKNRQGRARGGRPQRIWSNNSRCWTRFQDFLQGVVF